MTYSQEKTYLERYDPSEVINALYSSMYAIIADAFSLNISERDDVKKQLEALFKPLSGKKVTALPSIVERELRNAHYSKTLAYDFEESIEPNGTQATVQDWAIIFNELINDTLDVPPMLSSENLGHIVGILKKLGVGESKKSRYLPTSVRQIANKIDYLY